MGKTYAVACECGDTLTVSMSKAGSDVRCRCGLSVAVPSMTKLRAQQPDDLWQREFADERFWAHHGCYLCKSNVSIVARIECTLEPAETAVLSREPDGFEKFIQFLIPGAALLGFAYRQISDEPVLLREARLMEFDLQLCFECSRSCSLYQQIRLSLQQNIRSKDFFDRFPDFFLSNIVFVA